MIYTEKTLSQVLEVLRKRGYSEDFNLLEEGISYKGSELDLAQLTVDKIYRFTGFNDLDDEAILYAIHNKKDGVRGVFVNGYGTYSDSNADAIMDRITISGDDSDDWTK